MSTLVNTLMRDCQRNFLLLILRKHLSFALRVLFITYQLSIARPILVGELFLRAWWTYSCVQHITFLLLKFWKCFIDVHPTLPVHVAVCETCDFSHTTTDFTTDVCWDGGFIRFAHGLILGRWLKCQMVLTRACCCLIVVPWLLWRDARNQLV